MSFIESYETQLVDAARRRRDARLRNRIARWFRMPHRRGAAAVLAALVVAVPATAATVGWNPFDDPDAPTVSRRPPVPQLTATLGVLGREQTDADRGVATDRAAAVFSGQGFKGAQIDAIRLVDPERGLVLIPFERTPIPRDRQGRPAPGFDPARAMNAVCIAERTGDGFAGVGCHTADKIRRGLALSSGGGQVTGVVPDGVARVRLTRGDSSGEAAVRDNVFTATAPAPQNPAIVEWLAADGSLVRRIDLDGATP